MYITSDSHLMDKCHALADYIHYDQIYGPNETYYDGHLVPVMMIAKKILNSNDSNILGACLLHDAIEDGDRITASFISLFVNPTVSKIVEMVTDEPGETRPERKIKTYQKFINYKDNMGICFSPYYEYIKWGSAIVKACDRYINNQTCLKTQNLRMINTYINEYEKFKEVYYYRDDDISLNNIFKLLEEQYRKMKEKVFNDSY